MSDRLQWGILGTGGIARRFATDLRDSRTGRLVAIGSRAQETADRFSADFGGVRAHGSYTALLADPAVQAVYIAPPHPQHLEWTLAAAAAGKHILCEKPLALRGSDARRMVEVAQRHDVLLMEAFMYRCHPQTARLVELVRSGAIGELRMIDATFSLDFPFDPAHRAYNRELGGGGILDLGCYPVSFARLLAGAAEGRAFVEPVQFKGVGRLNSTTRVDEYAAAVATFGNGVVARLVCGFAGPREIRAQLQGTAGVIEVPMPFFPGSEARLTLRRSAATEPEEITVTAPSPIYALEADAVADALAKGQREVAAMTIADTLGNMAVLDEWLRQLGVSYDC
ncbi:MAG TPA: Gfo/Idh/MocA family oxidoreductase [Acidobacteriota bacterium]|nr:Gfo/Idh/MocA family oxidoreductase [Acidobacteriota bacterium]